MFSKEQDVYMHDEDGNWQERHNGVLVDVAFGFMNDGNLGMSVHNRDNGYTDVVAVNRIYTENNQCSAVGGHCHWQEIHVRIGERHLWFTANRPREFARLCEFIDCL